jgi:nitrogen fixation/metabolism regulation signal transduction histidine kinase
LDQLFGWVAGIVAASALLAFGLLVWRTAGLRRRLFLTLLAVALLPATTVGVVTWRETSDLGSLAEAPGLRASVEASVLLARRALSDRARELARRSTEPRLLEEEGYGYVLYRPDAEPLGRGEGTGEAPGFEGVRGTGRRDDLLYHAVELPEGEVRLAVHRLPTELVAEVEAAERGVAGLRQLGLYYEEIARGRALVVAATVLLLSVLLALVVSGLLTNRLVEPLADLVVATRRVTQGDRAFEVDTRAVDEVRDLEEAFNDMTSQLAQSEGRLRRTERLAAWQGIARRLAHEIKNPLTPIHLAVHRARKRSDDAVVVDSLLAIEEETANLQRLAEEFSALGRLPAPRLRPVSAASVAREVASLYVPDTFAFSVDGDATLEADEGQLRQVFSNLFKNAVEAMGEAGRILVRVRPDGEVRVEDDGPGLPEDVDRIFEPEFTTRSSGTGLGLAIVRRIVEDHGGQIDAHRMPAGGACMRLIWPVAEAGKSDG